MKDLQQILLFFFTVVPQISILSLLLRLNIIFLYAYLKDLYIFFMFLSMLTIAVGTFGAIYQTKLKILLLIVVLVIWVIY